MNRKRALRTVFFVLLGLVFIIGLWYLAAYCLYAENNSTLAYPHETLLKMGELLFFSGAKKTWVAMGWTTARVLIGFSAAFVFAALLGTLAALFPDVKLFLLPSVGAMKAIPTVAVVLILFGMLLAPETTVYMNYIPCVLTFIIAFPLIYEAFRAGIEDEDREVADYLRLDCGKRSLKGTLFVLLPDAWPYISLSIAQSVGLSFKTSIMAEVLVNISGVQAGLGTLIYQARYEADLPRVLAYAVIALILLAIIDIPFVVLKGKMRKRGFENGQRK